MAQTKSFTLKDNDIRQLGLPISEVWDAVVAHNLNELQILIDTALEKRGKPMLEERGLKIIEAEARSKAANNLDSDSDFTLKFKVAPGQW